MTPFGNYHQTPAFSASLSSVGALCMVKVLDMFVIACERHGEGKKSINLSCIHIANSYCST
jgi:hypothetical protein